MKLDALDYPLVRAYVAETPWAILQPKLTAIVEVLVLRASGGRLTDDEIRERIGAVASRPKLRQNGDIAVLPLMGTISHRMGLLAMSSGGTSTEAFTKDFRALVNDPSVAAIVIDVDSPGGAVDGVPELADEIYAARGIKPISAVANTLAASAGYWIAAAADELVVTPSGEVGSVGVLAAHQDMSAAYEQLGVKVSLISAGKFKAENNPYEPLTDEGRAAIQARVDDAYGMFTKALAKYRGVSVETVRTKFGEGRLVNPRDAVAAGMADRIATLDDVIATIGRRRTAPAASVAAGIPAVATFEEQSEAVLTAVQMLHTRVRALTTLRAGRTPLAQANVPRVTAHRDALLAIAEDYDALLATLTQPEAADVTRAEVERLLLDNLILAARANGVTI